MIIREMERKEKKKSRSRKRKEGENKFFFSTARTNFFSLVCSPVMMTVSFARSLSCAYSPLLLLPRFFHIQLFHHHAFSSSTRVYFHFQLVHRLIFWSCWKQYFGIFNLIKINYELANLRWKWRCCWRQWVRNGFWGETTKVFFFVF